MTLYAKGYIIEYSISNGGCMKKLGFTLAEVLITLGIIGIVAALTLPAIVQKQQKQEASSRLKKFVSTFSQAILFAESDYGPHAGWEMGEMSTYDSGLYFMNKYIKPYVKYIDIDKTKTVNNMFGAKMRFLDGSEVSVAIGACYDIIYDYNGEKKPNEAGKDIFRFLLCNSEKSCSIKPIFRSAYCQTKEIYDRDYPRTRDKMLELCKNRPDNCSILLENDNWEFKKDYPW